MVNTFFEFGVTQEDPVGIEDKIHNMLFRVNQYFANNSSLKNALIIISNLILDISSIYIVVMWLAFMKNLRMLISISIFFFIKIVSQLIFLVKPPIKNLVEFPGFPSLIYSYKLNEYFFFSGIAGFTFIQIYEFFNYSEKVKFSKVFGVLNSINLFFFSFLSLSYYSLYTIDILIGIIIAHYSIKLSNSIHFYFDYKILTRNEILYNDFFESFFSFLEIKKIQDINLSIEKLKITEDNIKDKDGNNRENENKKNNENYQAEVFNSNNKENNIVYNDE